MKALVFAVAALAFGSLHPGTAVAAPVDDAWFAQSTATAERAIETTVPDVADHLPAFMPFSTMARSATTAPSFFVNFVSGGPNSSGAPCFCATNQLTIPAPDNYVPPSFYWQYNVSWTNISYAGVCTAAFSVAAGSTVIYKQAKMGIKVSGAGAYDWGFVPPLATHTGPAMLLGRITCGKKTSTAKAPIYFQ